MESTKPAYDEEKGKRQDIKKATQEVKEKILAAETQTQKVASRALIEFQASQKFEYEIIEGSTIAYQVSFKDCKRALSRLQPKLDLCGLQPDDAPEKEGPESEEEVGNPKENHPYNSLYFSFVA